MVGQFCELDAVADAAGLDSGWAGPDFRTHGADQIVLNRVKK